MTDYVKSTNFTSKDSLATGNPLKIVKGAEFDTEFNNIATAVATKADLNSPVFIGNPAAPTPTFGDNATSIATTAFVQAALQALYPVGSVYINASVSTNPATLLGFGTWVTVGDGKVLVNQDTADTSFDVLGETGGSKDAITVAHTHTVSGTAESAGEHTHNIWGDIRQNFAGAGRLPTVAQEGFEAWAVTESSGTHTHTVSGTAESTGSSGTNANLQPYVVVKMWKRVS